MNTKNIQCKGIKGKVVVCFVLLFSILSLSYNPQIVSAADTTPPIASAPTAIPQSLKSGATSNSTVQMNEVGNIYMVKNGTGPSATANTSANLTNLVISGSPTNYSFSGSTYNYNGVLVANGISSVTVTPTGSGVITVNGNVVSSGSASGGIALTAGTETVIEVIATEVGKIPVLYLIRIMRDVVLSENTLYQGGKIAKIFGSGDVGYVAGQTRGLIMTTTDVNGATWGCEGTAISGADGQALGTGYQNTLDIVAGCGTAGIAARQARDYRGGGYSDWYLPSKDEFSHILDNGVNAVKYWTSSEYSNPSYAWTYHGGTWASTQDGKSWNVPAARFVRTFTASPLTTQATPTFSTSGVVPAGTTVTITSAGADAIYYTTNGSIPTTSSTNQAVTPLVINGSVTVKALAVKAGYNSAMASAYYTTTYDWNTAININHTAFIAKSSAVANTPYTVTVPADLIEGVYDIVAVDTANNTSSVVPGWLTVDNTSPTVALSYSESPVNAGTVTITATYSEPIASVPTISVNQPGSLDISNSTMTTASSSVYTYSYTANTANGSTYIDGTATVSLSATADAAGNSSGSPTNNTFLIDTVSPTVALSYSESPVNAGTVTITATYSEPIASVPTISVNQPGSLDISNSTMTTASSSVYTYSYTANTANGSTYIDGTATVSLSATADAAGNSSGSPTNNTFLIDTTGPIVVISAVCSIEGNGCTAEGISASPQESYMVRTISGTASDGGGVGSIDISIKDVSTNAWYNGSSFTDISETYRAATGTTTWSYNTTAVPFVINHVYAVNIRATDQASNVQIQSSTFKFTNAPPVVSNVSASQDQSGAVRVLYDVSDIESSQTTNYLFYSVGATLSTGITSNITTITVSDATYFPNSGTILIDDEIISYTSKTGSVLGGMVRGALATTPTTHTGGSSVFIQAITTSGTGLSDEGTGKLITWTTPTDITGYDSASQLIKVVANDGASGSMIGSASPAVFTLDVKSPEIADADFYIDASVSTSSTAGVKLFATDLSQMQYRLCLNADFSADSLNTGLGSCTTWSATSTAVDLTPELNLIYTATSTGEQAVSVQVRDVYGNTISKTKTTPVMPVSFLYKDVSNLGATPPTYREYLDWATTDESNFLRYEVWFSSSLNSTYTLLTNVSNRVNSFYTHNILTNTDATYNYKIRTIGTHGDISRFTTVASDVPNGIGGTGGDNTPPVITLTGASPFSVTVGGTYTEPGVSAVDETDGAVEVTSSGTVNTAAVGSYVITYVAHDTSNNIATRTRTVNVVLAPTYNITATAGAHGSISPNGVTAVNSGTSQVYTITPDENYIVGSLTVDGVNLVPATEYTFTNVVGIHTIEATFVLENIIPPVVTIVGDNPMNVNTGTTFVDPGVTAYESDGSTLITDSTKIVRSIATADGARLSSVSTATGASGIVITYTVTGADGGIAVITRTVNVIDVTPPIISDIATPIITSDSVAIVWKTNEVSNSQVSYGTTAGSYTQNSTLNINLVLNHLVALTDLTPDTTYYYVIKSTDGIGNTVTSEEQSFSTIKIKETVIFSGGGGGSGGVLQSVYDALLEENEANKAKVKLQETDAPIISNVGISNITAFSATVSFDTNKNTIAFIKYGKDTTYTNTAGDDSFKTNHSIVLRGLTMGTEYHVKVSASDRFSNTSSSEDKTFKTQFLTENIAELKKIENVEQFQNEIESTIESILPSLVPPFIDKPIISDITENGATVTFRTNIKAYPVVSYAPQNTYDATKENPYDAEVSDTAMKNIVHSVKLTGLKSNTRYHLMAKAFSLPQVVGKSEDITFTTAASKIRASVTDVKKDSFVVMWSTDELTSSIVEYRNVKTGINARITNEIKNYSHSIKVENLLPGTLYKVSVSGINANGNYVEGISELNVKTSTDNTPPTVSNVKVSSAFIAGRTDRVQTIVSWQTDEPATSVFYFEEGSGSTSKKPANKQEDLELTKNHVVIIMTLKPGTVYRFMVSSTDDANNTFSSPVRTIVTPQKSESIVDVIFKNFDDTFNFIKNVR